MSTISIQTLALETLGGDLWNVVQPPEKLFIQGKSESLELLRLLPERGLAVVGTRNPQPKSMAYLRQRILELRGSGLIVISGLARGIDSVAHQTALEAGLSTIAILGFSLSQRLSRESSQLRNEILQKGGLLVSEFPDGSPGYPSHFLQRNRIIAGWSKATWVVEAGARSGALNTAKWAREMNRTCFSVPTYPGDLTLAGNQLLLDRDHAIPFWGVHSLGAAWLELASFPLSSQVSVQSVLPLEDPKLSLLIQEIQQLTLQRGGAQVPELLDWALTQGWNPGTFFNLLQSAMQSGRVRDFSGGFVSVR